MQITNQMINEILCQRCHKEPKAKGQDICLACQYNELGEKMFVETVEYGGQTIQLDLTGRAHIPALAIGDYHPIFVTLYLAQQWIDTGPLTA